MTEEAAEEGRGARVLIAEDEQHLGLLLEHFLAARGHRVTRVRDGREALTRLRAEPYDAALVDLHMPGADGLAVLRAARALSLPTEVAVVTGHGSVDTAVEAMRAGAYDYVTKPYRMAEVDALVRRMHEKRSLAREVAALGTRLAAGDEFVTVYAPLRAVLRAVDEAARGAAPMLITGEAGTGRSLLARRAHVRSGRPTRALVTVDCRALSTDAAAALFGDGVPATSAPGGLAAAAEGGTLVLAHVDALPADAQRALAERLTAPEAAWHPRVIATRDVAAARAAALGDRGAWQAPALGELLGRVAVELPPLRERPGDVAALARHFAARQVRPSRRAELAPDALDALEAQSWPGNVAELKAVIEGAISRAAGGLVDAEALRPGPGALARG